MYFVYNGTPVYYTKKGEGEALLLLHGWGGSSAVFDFLTNRFQSEYSVIAPDFPPFGLSGDIIGDYTVTDYKNLVLNLLNENGIKKTHIICHSFGGRVAIKLASLNPDRVKKLILCSAAGMPVKKTLKKRINRLCYSLTKFLASKGLVKQNSLKKFFSSDYKALPEKMQKTFVNITKEVQTNEAKSIKAPSLIIWGKKDTETPLYMAKTLHSNINNSKLTLIDGGHYGFLDSSEEFYKTVAEFLRNK